MTGNNLLAMDGASRRITSAELLEHPGGNGLGGRGLLAGLFASGRRDDTAAQLSSSAAFSDLNGQCPIAYRLVWHNGLCQEMAIVAILCRDGIGKLMGIRQRDLAVE